MSLPFAQGMIVAAYDLETILPLIKPVGGRRMNRARVNGPIGQIEFRCQTKAMRLFKATQRCSYHGCDIVGNRFLMIETVNGPRDCIPFLVHSANSQITMMTLDHIIPKWCGGHDSIDNLQVMCHRCNSSKKSRRFDLIGHPIVRLPTAAEKLAAYQWHDALRNASYEEREEAFKRHMMSQGFKGRQ